MSKKMFMNLAKSTHSESIIEAIEILQKVRVNIADNSDCTWTLYTNADALRQELDNWICQLSEGDTKPFDTIYRHFLPTATFQEHAMANGWTEDYMNLASQFDKVYQRMRGNG